MGWKGGVKGRGGGVERREEEKRWGGEMEWRGGEEARGGGVGRRRGEEAWGGGAVPVPSLLAPCSVAWTAVETGQVLLNRSERWSIGCCAKGEQSAPRPTCLDAAWMHALVI